MKVCGGTSQKELQCEGSEVGTGCPSQTACKEVTVAGAEWELPEGLQPFTRALILFRGSWGAHGF